MKRNPLSVCFGMALKKARSEFVFDLPQKNFATDQLGVAPSFYRLIEAGINYLAVNKAPKLANAFEHRLSTRAIMELLSAISFLDVTAKNDDDGSKRKNDDNYGAYLDDAAEVLVASLQDSKEDRLKLLLEKFRQKRSLTVDRKSYYASVFCLIDSIPTAKLVELKIIQDLGVEVFQFLTEYVNYGQEAIDIQHNYPVRFFSDIPSLYKDFLESTKSNLQSLPQTFGPETSLQWELEHIATFKRLFAVCLTDETVLNEANLRNYNYPYLWKDGFESATFFFLDSRRGPDGELDPQRYAKNKSELFIKLLRKNLKKSNDEASRYKSVKQVIGTKVNFIKLSEDAEKQASDLINSFQDNQNNVENIQSIWVFEHLDGSLTGGFSYIITKGKNTGILLTYMTFGETMKTFSCLQKMDSDSRKS